MSTFICLGDEMTRNQQKRVKRSSGKVKGGGRWKIGVQGPRNLASRNTN